jgi:hypothetical protein
MIHAPRVFVGSASEHLHLLQRLNVLNTRSRVRYLPWTNLGGFPYNEYTLTSLTKRLCDVDGAAFLFWGSDKTWWRGENRDTPRDNVVFEAGMAIGTLGLARTAIVTDTATKVPTDLLGLNPLAMTLTGDNDIDASILHDLLERFFVSLSPVKQLLRDLWSAQSYRIFFHSFDNAELGEFEDIVNLNAVRAISLLTDHFAKHGISSTLHSSRSQDLVVDDNLVVLGSSASNRLTRRILADTKCALPFECHFDATTMQDRCITSSLTGQSYRSQFDGDALTVEYALLTRIPNPFRRHTEVIIAAGNYGLGTLAAVMSAVSADLLAASAHNYGGLFQAIIEVPVLGYYTVGVPKIMEFTKLTDTSSS